MGLNLKSLIGKLNDTARSALEAAAGLCLSRTHYDIEIEHYLMKLLDVSGQRFRSDHAALRGRQISPCSRADSQPG